MIKIRDSNRIDEFCQELATLWKNHYPDMRFGQFVLNLYTYISNNARDMFFVEDQQMMQYIKEFCGEEKDDKRTW